MAENKLQVSLAGKLADIVNPLIQEKLAELLGSDESDSNLYEYIALLINNKRPKNHVATDLEAFFGKVRPSSSRPFGCSLSSSLGSSDGSARVHQLALGFADPVPARRSQVGRHTRGIKRGQRGNRGDS